MVPDPQRHPRRLVLELTNQCNLACPGCRRNRDAADAGRMDPALFRSLVLQAGWELPLGLTASFRGESLLHPETLPLLAYAKNKGLTPVELASNGVSLDRRLSASLLDLGLDAMTFNLETLDPAEYSRRRPGGELARVMQNLEGFISLRESGGYATKVRVAVRPGGSRSGREGLSAFWGARVDQVVLPPAHQPAPGRRGPCAFPQEELAVYWDGTVAACRHDWTRAEPLGDLNTQTLIEVWQSPALRTLRAGATEASCLACHRWTPPTSSQGEAMDLFQPTDPVSPPSRSFA